MCAQAHVTVCVCVCVCVCVFVFTFKIIFHFKNSQIQVGYFGPAQLLIILVQVYDLFLIISISDDSAMRVTSWGW